MARLPPLLAASAIVLLLADPAGADPPIVVSHQADTVSVTVYRNPQRQPNRAIAFDTEDEDPEPLGGYAMIAETRTVDLPPGEAVVRFEGVASGIVPQSAIMLGGTLKEKNFDSRLLSQRGLLDAFTGQRVTIRSTDDQTGQVSEEAATIVSQPDRLLLHTRRGYEAVTCSSGIETVLFPGVPVDLTAKPTLSMTTRPDSPGGRQTVTLLYLAGNFDWQANYVMTFSPDAGELTMLGWMTLASRDRTSFPAAELSAVAGLTARADPPDADEDDEDYSEPAEQPEDPYAPDNIDISFDCWPQGQTAGTRWHAVLFGPGSLPRREFIAGSYESYYFGQYAEGRCDDDEDGCDREIIVTGSRISSRTDLGDLKLYTVPFPTDVLAQSMKQVRFMDDHKVKGELVYNILSDGESERRQQLLFRFHNRKRDGAGDPLPAGRITLFQPTTAGRQFLGETWLNDKAVDEDVEITLPNPDKYGITFETDEDDDTDKWTDYTATLTNKGDAATQIEVEFNYDDYTFSRFSGPVRRHRGAWQWRVRLDPGQSAKLRYRRTDPPENDEDDYEE
ncbi:hypothetical protein [Novosphingobium sp.]|uniref:DUF4139 domain-containing protein n=1 Tax=Novosphingobium sp. TaxID=1874826 RepID=UPI0025FDB46D|nr:hypothetical protein [Novosphingobium sp.]MCC6925155.1 hypothetical protein [Novosphingobium sp.]